ncbi:MAG: hypothetical protein ABIG71_04865, partial [Candidatus Uhrbacteria bacterium]
MQFEDPEMRVFANQLLTTRTWYRGTNPDGAEQAFYQLMSDTLTGRVPLKKALELAAQKVAQTL